MYTIIYTVYPTIQTPAMHQYNRKYNQHLKIKVFSCVCPYRINRWCWLRIPICAGHNCLKSENVLKQHVPHIMDYIKKMVITVSMVIAMRISIATRISICTNFKTEIHMNRLLVRTYLLDIGL